MAKIAIWSHQGKVVPLSPGNHLADFEDAVQECTDGVEADVSFVKVGSGEEVFIHHPGQRFSALRFGEFVEFLKKHPRLECFLDIKQNDIRLAEAVAKTVVMHHLEKRVFLTFCQTRIPWLGLETSAEMLLMVKKVEPKIQTHLLVTFPFSLPGLIEKYHPDFVSFGWLDDSFISKLFFKGIIVPFFNLPGQIKEAQRIGVRLLAGISNREEDIRYFASLGVDAVMTEDIETAMRTVGRT